MSDKLRPGVSVTPTFVDGESPPAAKLNSISVQMKHAAEQLEEAVGDIHSQSWPYSASNLTTLSPKYAKHRTSGLDLGSTAERTLDIATLARLIGPASNMNSRTLHERSIQENVDIGLHEFSLRFIPDDPSAVGTVFSDATVFANYFSAPGLMTTAGDYHVSELGKVYCVSASNGGTVTYNTTPATYGGGMNAQDSRFNVIPDPNQIAAGGAGLSFSAPDSQGRRTATLPTVTHAQSNWEGDSTVLGADDIVFGQQLRLPTVLVDNFTAGEEIPTGYLYVKNETTGKVYEDAVYYYGTDTTFLILEDDLTADIGAGHKFSCFTVGNDITSAIDDLRVKSYHNHDRRFGEPFVDIDGITGFLREAGNSGAWIPSDIPSNFAPQYLHRDGFDDTVARDVNWNDQNVMRGHLMIGRSAGTPGTYVGAGESKRLYFSDTNGYLYRQSNGDFVFENIGSIRFRKNGALGGTGVFEEGYKGVRGTSANAVHVLTTEITITNPSSNQSIDFTMAPDIISGWIGTEVIVGATGYIDTGASYVMPNDNVTANRSFTLTSLGNTIQYVAGTMNIATPQTLYLTVWYTI